MNYFAHAVAFLKDPYFVAGTGVPDMLMVVDRGLKLRLKHARPFMDNSDPIVAAVAGGVHRHLHDDRVFHKTTAFAETSLALTLEFRDALQEESGLRPRFLGHLMTELLLDAAIIEEDTRRLDHYYQIMDSIDAEVVQRAVNLMAPRSTERLSTMILGVCRERFLWDYLNDAKLMVRLNQIMRRVGLDVLPGSFEELLPQARRLVARRKEDLLHGTEARRTLIGK